MIDQLQRLLNSLENPLNEDEREDVLLQYKGPKLTLFTLGQDRVFIMCGGSTIEIIPAHKGFLQKLHKSTRSRYRAGASMIKPKVN